MAHEGYSIIARTDAHYVPVRNKSNDYMIDHAVQKNRAYSGVKGLAEQDIMIQESQGPIVDCTRETLTATDAAVVRFRRTVMAAAAALADSGEELSAPLRHEAYTIRPGSWFTAKGTPFEDVLMERLGHNRGLVA